MYLDEIFSIIIYISIFAFIFFTIKKNRKRKEEYLNFENIIFSILTNEIKISKIQFEIYKKSNFYKQLYIHNKKRKQVNNKYIELIKSNYLAFERTIKKEGLI